MAARVLDAKLALSLAAPLSRGRYAVPVRRGEILRLERHPQAPDANDLAAVRAWARRAKRPTAVDLFCGAGGLSLGLEQAGFSVLVGADNDPFALETHQATIPGISYLGDLSDPSDFIGHLEAWGIETVDLVAGGVPCQPFSRAGRSKIRSLVESRVRLSDDQRVNLWRSFIRVVEHLQPAAVLLENVPDLAEWEEGEILVAFCESLRALGYETEARILPAFEHGVPQHRSRLFIVGISAGQRFEWPVPSTRRPTLWDAISDLPAVPGGQTNDRLPYGGPHSDLQHTLRASVVDADREVVYDHITRAVRSDDLQAFELLPEGGTYDDLPKDLQRYRTDIFTDKYKRLSRDDLSRTITAHIARDGYWYIHPTQHRTLSIREAARVQTFPDSVRFAGPPSQRYRQIGNAVPVLLAQALGRSMHRTLRGSKRRARRRDRDALRLDLLRWHSDNSRSFPWRDGREPWHVLLAEMCLHRTRADQVGSIYERLIDVAPKPAALIENEGAAREVLASLGLRWRVDNIIRVAADLVERFGGVVPSTREDLLSLPGVGDYAANAVLCFGFGQPAILLDTNTQRIVSRLTNDPKSMKRWQLRLDLYKLAGPQGADQEFNYALLDLGALVCRTGVPKCLACPISAHCATFRKDV